MRKLITALLFSVALSLPSYAQDSGSCDPSRTDTALGAVITQGNMDSETLTGAALTAFNAELASENNADPKDFPDMDELVAVFVQPQNDANPEDNVALVMAFKDHCLISHIEIPTSAFKAIEGRTHTDAK